MKGGDEQRWLLQENKPRVGTEREKGDEREYVERSSSCAMQSFAEEELGGKRGGSGRELGSTPG